jgi:hypothetical protein
MSCRVRDWRRAQRYLPLKLSTTTSCLIFWDKFGAHLVEKLRASGASPAALQAQLQEVAKYKELYKNPLLNAALTFIEPFPIRLVITLISAAVLRRNLQSQPDQSPLPAS